ncbi:Metallo-peptidase family M12-domain-containing protein [Blakeslea trispora]|nr:Metallo-peptidase family M12-domain-containing protein [Blakeslea trispora]
MKLICILLYFLLSIASFVKCRSVNNKQLLWVEPIQSVKLDIAKRSDLFFEKRDISPNHHFQPIRPQSLQFDDSFRLSIDAYNKTFYLHLTPNYDLFHSEAVIHQQGKSVRMNPSDYRVYRGHVIDPIYSEHYWLAGIHEDMQDKPGVLGWARIVVRNDLEYRLDHPLFEGAFTLYGDTYHVKLKENYHLTKRSDDAELLEHHQNVHMVTYRDSDTALEPSVDTHEHGCGFDKITHATQKRYNPLEIDYTPFGTVGKTLTKRAPTGCPTAKKILYMGVAADCTYVKYYQNADNARMQIINDWNSVSSVYDSAFNVAIGLINITIMDSTCPSTPASSTGWNQACSTSYSISTRLSDFSRWRGNIGNDGAGLWHLMTNCATGHEVGIAWMSQVCNTGSVFSSSSNQYTSGTGVSSIIRDEWKVVAHEVGHGFGAIHDCTSQNCPCSGSSCQCCPLSSTQCDAGGRYFMNPTSNASSDAFSPCSINSICTEMPSYTSCLQDPGTRNVTTLQMCGNGIKENGEDCDTGGKDSNCCDPSTCKFKSGAVCDDFNDLCCNNCQLRPANYTCRPASGECDVAEVCSGTTGDCPVDKYKDDLISCSNGMQCASGQCTSRDSQCAARGTTNNIKKSCAADNGCAMSCQNPSSSFSCIIFPGSFMDGTPCGVGGVCKSGSCDQSNFGNNALNWINSHLYIVIPVAVVVGLMFLFCLLRCCCYPNAGGYNNLGKTTIYTIPGQQAAYPTQYSTTPQPYYPQQPYYPNNNGWVDPTLYNGPPGARNYPQQPLPAYSQATPQHDAYELNNANHWQNHQAPGMPAPPGSPAPHYSQTPTPPVNGNTAMANRPHNEGVV